MNLRPTFLFYPSAPNSLSYRSTDEQGQPHLWCRFLNPHTGRRYGPITVAGADPVYREYRRMHWGGRHTLATFGAGPLAAFNSVSSSDFFPPGARPSSGYSLVSFRHLLLMTLSSSKLGSRRVQVRRPAYLSSTLYKTIMQLWYYGMRSLSRIFSPYRPKKQGKL